MAFNKRAEIYKIEKVKDGYGGYIEEELFIKGIYCEMSSMSQDKQLQYFSTITRTAITITCLIQLDYNDVIKIDGENYKIIYATKTFNKYIYDLERLDNV